MYKNTLQIILEGLSSNFKTRRHREEIFYSSSLSALVSSSSVVCFGATFFTTLRTTSFVPSITFFAPRVGYVAAVTPKQKEITSKER